MEKKSFRSIVESTIQGPASPWGATPERCRAVRTWATQFRAFTSLMLPTAEDLCAAYEIRFRQSSLESKGDEACTPFGPIMYGRDLPPDERQLVLYHGVAHRLLPLIGRDCRPTEVYAWLMALELAVPRDILRAVGVMRFLEVRTDIPKWAVEFVARIHGIVIPTRSMICRAPNWEDEEPTSSWCGRRSDKDRDK